MSGLELWPSRIFEVDCIIKLRLHQISENGDAQRRLLPSSYLPFE